MYNNDNTYDDTSDNAIHKNDYIKRTIMKMIKIGIKKIKNNFNINGYTANDDDNENKMLTMIKIIMTVIII